MTTHNIYVLVPFVPRQAILAAATRLATMVEALCAVVVLGLHSGLPGPLIVRLWDRLTRLANRFNAIAARPIKPRATPNPIPATPKPPAETCHDPRFKTRRLPTADAWLLKLLPEAEPFVSQLQAMLDDPAIAALLQAKPSLIRLLRPICRMLGVQPPLDPEPQLAPPGPPARPRSPPAQPSSMPADPVSQGPHRNFNPPEATRPGIF